MRRKTLSFALLSILILAAYATIAPAQPPTPWTNMIIDTICDPESLDPAWAYDTTSSEVIMNVYETLIFFNVEWNSPETPTQAPGPYSAGKTDAFVPQLATSMPTIKYHDPPLISPLGLPIYSTWYFEIRTDVTFHFSGNTLTPADVEYSFERALVQDRIGGPTWMLYQPLLATPHAVPPSGLLPEEYKTWGNQDDTFGGKIDYAVQSNSTHVWFNLSSQFPQLAFKQILGQTVSSVVERDWAVSEGDLPANWASQPWREIWDPNLDGYPDDGWHNPPISYLEDAIGHAHQDGGTGPYQLSYWTPSVGYSVVKYNNYRQGWPAPILGHSGGARLAGNVDRITWNIYADWTVRRANFLAGQSDTTYVPRIYRDQILGATAPDGELIRCFYRSKDSGKGILGLSCDGFFFNLNISRASPYCFNIKPSGTFGPDGIPLDIFTDTNVRRGFAYAFDYDWFINTIMLGEGEQPSDPIVKGLPYDNPSVVKYTLNLNTAEYYLKLAWGGVDIRSGIPGHPVLPEDPTKVTPGALWNGGMKFCVCYNTGNPAREIASGEIVNKINSLNPVKFNLVTLGLTWNSIYLPAMAASQLPLFINGWAADFTDPHDFAYPFMHSEGTLARSQSYSNPFIDALVEQGIATPDMPWEETLSLTSATPVNVGDPLNTVWTDGTLYYRLNKWIEQTSLGDGVLGPADWIILETSPCLFYDINGNGVWDSWIDANSNGNWDAGEFVEPAVNDINFDHKLDVVDKVLVPSHFALGLSQPGISDRYYDANNNHIWDVGEAAVRDDTAPFGLYTVPGDDILVPGSAPVPPGGILREPQSQMKGFQVETLTGSGTGPYTMSLKANRELVYFALQQLYYEDVPSVPLAQVLMRHWEQPWMRGWYYNPLYGGSLTPGIDSTAPTSTALYAYHMWKAKTHFGDINWDGLVDILDSSTLSSSWTGPPRGAAYFLPQADVTGGKGGTVGSEEGFVKGIPDGAVGVDDLGLLSAYWG